MQSPARILILGILLTAGAAACTADDASTTSGAAVAAEAPATQPASHEDDLPPIPEPTEAGHFGARVSEYQIDLTTHTVPSGQSTFHILNAGNTAHLFIVRSDDVYFATQHIPPGDSATLQVDLPPGEYHIVCTVRDEFDHISEGERETLIVE